MRTYEVTLPGFDGRTDRTDYLVKWVKANSVNDVIKIYPFGNLINPLPFMPSPDTIDLDLTVPGALPNG